MVRGDPKVELGRLLFHDKRLSGNGFISCSSCHDPALAFTDGRVRSVGMGDLRGGNAPTLANVASRKLLTFAGKKLSLEAQAEVALLERGEMGAERPDLVEKRLSRIPGYRPLFERAFGTRDITMARIVGAIAAFERTLVSRESPYDRFVAGEGDLSDPQRRGMAVFFGRGRCSTCHPPPDFTDDELHSTGSARNSAFGKPGHMSVSGRTADFGKIRTPTLREVARTAPYFHDGSLEDLESVVQFYDGGGNPALGVNVEVRPLSLSSRDREDLLDFLTALSGEGWIEPPPLRFPE